MHLFRSLVFVLAFGWFPASVFSQGLGLSPYSVYGLGDLASFGMVRNTAMGGTGIAAPHNNYTSQLNPALIAFSNFYTIYEFGAGLQSKWLKSDLNNQKNTSGNITYLSLLFPLTKKMGINVGLRPFSSVNSEYYFTSSVSGDSTLTVNDSYKYSGGINCFFVGLGYKITKNFSFGVQLSYLFGSITKASSFEIADFNYPIYSTANYKQLDSYSLVGIKPGFMYRHNISDAKRLNIGLTADFYGNMGSTSYLYTAPAPGGSYPFTNLASSVYTDTANTSSTSIRFPLGVGLGVSYEYVDKLVLSLDFTANDWAVYRGFNKQNNLQNSYKIMAGVEWIPDISSIKSFARRVSYRAGSYYEQTPYVANSISINEFGFSLGAGLPVRKASSMVNLALIVGSRGTTTNGNIKETFFKVMVGFTINDRWFIRPKID